MSSISVIIPILNEADNIENLLSYLSNCLQEVKHEIIVIDGGSSDDSVSIIKEFKSVKLLKSKKANRAIQMNLGAASSTMKILYFLHADCLPPTNFSQIIMQESNTNTLGCFYGNYDSENLLFKINNWFSKLPFQFCRGGDQSLFIYTDTFKKIGKFDESFVIMEEYEFFKRALNAQCKFIIAKHPIKISLRKYKNRSWIKVSIVNLIAMFMFMVGINSKKIQKTYKNLLN